MLYNLQYRDTATLTTTEVTGIDALFLDVSDLDQGEQYEFRVQEDDGGVVSDYSDWFGFITQVETTYNLQYRDLATLTTTTVAGIDALFYDVVGLKPSTQYEFRVQEDDGTSVSAYSDYFPFTTAVSTISGKVTATIVIESLITASVKESPLINADLDAQPIITASVEK